MTAGGDTGHPIASRVAPSDLVVVGAVRGGYGIKGWARIAPVADGDALLACRRWWLLDEGEFRPLEIENARRHAGAIVAKWAGCGDKEGADALAGRQVAVPRSEFPAAEAGQHYWLDLVGSRVVNRAGLELGTVEGLGDNGAGQWLDVVDGNGRRCLVPLIEHYVDAIDSQQRLITVDWDPEW